MVYGECHFITNAYSSERFAGGGIRYAGGCERGNRATGCEQSSNNSNACLVHGSISFRILRAWRLGAKARATIPQLPGKRRAERIVPVAPQVWAKVPADGRNAVLIVIGIVIGSSQEPSHPSGLEARFW